MENINPGDQVRHKHLLYNNGLSMNVSEVENDKALCDFFDGPEMEHKQEWFHKNDLEIVRYGDGGFRNQGE